MPSYKRQASTVGPWESVSQVSVRPERSTGTPKVPRHRHDIPGNSDTSRSADDRTSRWLADIPETDSNGRSTVSYKTSSQSSDRNHITRSEAYEGGKSGRSSASRDLARSHRSEKSDSTVRPIHSHVNGSGRPDRDYSSTYSKPRNVHHTSSASRAHSTRPIAREEYSERSGPSPRRSSHRSSHADPSLYHASHDRSRAHDVPDPHGPWDTYHATKTVVEHRPGRRPVLIEAEEEWYGPQGRSVRK